MGLLVYSRVLGIPKNMDGCVVIPIIPRRCYRKLIRLCFILIPFYIPFLTGNSMYLLFDSSISTKPLQTLTVNTTTPHTPSLDKLTEPVRTYTQTTCLYNYIFHVPFLTVPSHSLSNIFYLTLTYQNLNFLSKYSKFNQ